MKRLLILIGLLASLAIVQVTFAQTDQGSIVFEEKVNMHRRLPPDRQEMKAMIPEYRTNNFTMVFNADESLYKPIIEDEEDPFDNAGGQGPQIRIRQPNIQIYLQQSTSRFITKQEFMGKDYLIVDTVKMAPWK